MGDRFQNKIKQAKQREVVRLSQTQFSPKVAISPLIGEYGRDNNYKLIFRYYNHGQCELKRLQDFKPLINKFNFITSSDYKVFKTKGLVYKSGDYVNLFNGLPLDVDNLEEIEISEVGRIIFFRTQTFLCVVAVLVQHRRT